MAKKRKKYKDIVAHYCELMSECVKGRPQEISEEMDAMRELLLTVANGDGFKEGFTEKELRDRVQMLFRGLADLTVIVNLYIVAKEEGHGEEAEEEG